MRNQTPTGLGQMVATEKRSPEIGSLMNRMQSQLETLEKEIKELEARLSPILRNVPKTDTAGPKPPEPSIFTPLGGMLQSQIDFVRRLVEYVESIIQLTEV